jgi:hypothetical protein
VRLCKRDFSAANGKISAPRGLIIKVWKYMKFAKFHLLRLHLIHFSFAEITVQRYDCHNIVEQGMEKPTLPESRGTRITIPQQVAHNVELPRNHFLPAAPNHRGFEDGVFLTSQPNVQNPK